MVFLKFAPCFVLGVALVLRAGAVQAEGYNDAILAIVDGRVSISRDELIYAFNNVPTQLRSQIEKDEASRYELIASLVSSKRILEGLQGLDETEDQDLFYGFHFAILAAAKEFDERAFQRRLVLPNLDALAEERYRISRQEIALVPEERWLSHILLLCSDQCDEAAKQEELENIRGEVLAGESFSDLALTHSQDPGSRQRGGRLSRGIQENDPNVDETFRATAFALAEVGEVSGIVRSRFGFHIMRLEKVVPQRERSFEEIKESLVEAVEERYREDAYREYLLSMGPTEELYINGDVVDSIFGPLPEVEADDQKNDTRNISFDDG